MQVILREDYPSLGYVGDVVEVRPGYARNFLIPRGLASETSSRNARMLKHRMDQIRAKKLRFQKEAQAKATQMEGMLLLFQLKIGEHGKSFGSITARDIHLELERLGHPFDKKQIKLAEPIKAGGEYKVSIQLHSEVIVELPVKVEAEVVASKAPTEKKSARKAKASEDFDQEDEAGESFESDVDGESEDTTEVE